MGLLAVVKDYFTLADFQLSVNERDEYVVGTALCSGAKMNARVENAVHRSPLLYEAMRNSLFPPVPLDGLFVSIPDYKFWAKK